MAEAPTAATPIFVLGTARSGTTWLANLLISHPEIAGLAAAEHQGIHESHLFDHTRYALAGTMSCAAFAERYRAEDYFRLAGVSAAELCAAAPAEADTVAFFGVLMTLVARKAGARYWLEKTPKHAIYADEIMDRFPDARFVLITRDFQDTMRSQLARYANPDAGWLRQRLEKVFRYVSDRRAMRRVARRAGSRVREVSYETLAADTDGVTAGLLRWLGLPVRPLRSAFPPDSSFGPGGRPGHAAPAERVALAAGHALCAAVPLPMLKWLRERRDRRDARTFPKYQLLRTP